MLTRPVVLSLARLAFATTAIVAMTYQFATSADTSFRQANFFGFFTIQSNLILAAVYLLSALAPAAPGEPTRSLVRAAATTYIVIVGIVYATLLAPLGVAGGVPVPWANVVLHVVTPLYGIVDWLASRDRDRLPLDRLWVVLLYPAVWLVVVLLRGATDGWVPYPFLDPEQGYAAVAGYCLVILVAFLVVGAVVLWGSRVGRRVVSPTIG
jgi:polyferredoxin